MSIEFLKPLIESLLEGEDIRLRQPKTIAKSVLRLADHYRNDFLSGSPWEKSWGRIGGLAYYLPLSVARLQWILQSARGFNFFNELNQIIDVGSGLGALSCALHESPVHERSISAISIEKLKLLFMEPHREARRIHQQIHQKIGLHLSAQWIKHSPRNLNKTAVLCSYSLNEMNQLPEWVTEAEALILIEPATFEQSRKLQSLRKRLIEKGFFVWAPCVHQEGCPLLTSSRKDWCHVGQPIRWPDWFMAIERELPMSNRRLEFSYLLMRKTPPQALKSAARVVSQELSTKGKSQIWICRGPHKEQLTWLDRNRLNFNLSRGDLIQIHHGAGTRIESEDTIHKFETNAMLPS